MKCLNNSLLVAALVLAMNVPAFALENNGMQSDDKKENPELFKKVETSLQGAQYEMLDNYCLDKYTGDVYYVDVRINRIQRVLLSRESVETDIVPSPRSVNYQLLAVHSHGAFARYYLINLHTGDMWHICNDFSRKARLEYVPVER